MAEGPNEILNHREQGSIMRGSKYSPEMKAQVAQTLVATGSQLKTSDLTGVPQTTISDWANNDPDFIQLCDISKENWIEEFDARTREAAELAAEQLVDRIKEGDPIIDKAGNRIGRKPLPGKELAVIAGIMVDKSLTFQSIPKPNKSRSEDTSRTNLQRMLKEFEEVVDQHEKNVVTQ